MAIKTDECKQNTLTNVLWNLGNWSTPPPVCNPVQCPTLFLDDPHLSLTELNASAWGKATFKCSWGYRLNGPASLDCLANGAWSGAIPRCRCEYR